MQILNTNSTGTLHKIFTKAKNYTVSEYFDDVELGKYKDTVQCQNLEATTFESNSFDIIITEDVFEHIANPKTAFREVKRILKPNGLHIATIPVFWELDKSRTRAILKDGKVTDLLQKEYHGDPLRRDGILVYTDFGKDIISEYCSLTGPTELITSHRNHVEESIFGIYNNWIFISKKV